MMNVCSKCLSVCGWVFVILGVLFLLQNLGAWDFWKIQWYTALFIVMGLGTLASKSCPDCCKARGDTPKKK